VGTGGVQSLDSLPSDLREQYEAVAAIREFDGGLPRELAEALASAETIDRMNNGVA
jgi:ATP/maltotriose-dependent transcriptional regulator MalT